MEQTPMPEPLTAARDPSIGDMPVHIAGPTPPGAGRDARWQVWLDRPWQTATLVFVLASLAFALVIPGRSVWFGLHLYFLVIGFIAYSLGWQRAAVASVLAICCTVLLAGDPLARSATQRAVFVVTTLPVLALLILLGEGLRRARVRADALLRRSQEQEQRLNLTLAAGSIGTFDILLGRDPADAVMELWHLATDLIDRERLTALVVRRLEQGEQDIHIEYRIVRANGTSRWLELRGHVARGDDDRPVRFYGMTLDVSERQAAQEQRRQSQAMFDKLFTLSPFGAGQLDTEGRFIRVNPAFCGMVGLTAEHLVGRSFLDITHPDDRSTNELRYAEIMRGEAQQYIVRKRFVTSDGHTVRAHVSGNLVRDQDGLPQYAIAIVVPDAESPAPRT
jgi:PAS domain S-box-containing protein